MVGKYDVCVLTQCMRQIMDKTAVATVIRAVNSVCVDDTVVGVC